MITNEQFARLFNPNEGDEVILWIEDGIYAGLSVLRPYKTSLGFIPAMTKSGQEDTKALIKIGLHIPENTKDKSQLFLSVSKHSKYKSSHFGIDFDNPDAPTKESLSESEKSKQPIDIEERERFFASLDPVSFYDEKNKKEVTLNDLIDCMYNLHLLTISGGKSIILKTKLGSKAFVCNRVIPTFISFLTKKLLVIFGKEVIDDKKDFAVGLFKPFVFQKHINTKYPYSLPFFSSDVRVSLINILWISLSLLAFWFYDPVGKSISELFTVALVAVFVAVFEFIIPYIIMLLINALIISRIKLESRRIKFN